MNGAQPYFQALPLRADKSWVYTCKDSIGAVGLCRDIYQLFSEHAHRSGSHMLLIHKHTALLDLGGWHESQIYINSGIYGVNPLMPRNDHQVAWPQILKIFSNRCQISKFHAKKNLINKSFTYALENNRLY